MFNLKRKTEDKPSLTYHVGQQNFSNDFEFLNHLVTEYISHAMLNLSKLPYLKDNDIPGITSDMLYKNYITPTCELIYENLNPQYITMLETKYFTPNGGVASYIHNRVSVELMKYVVEKLNPHLFSKNEEH